MAEVHVCHAGTCLNRGAEGVLTEIEELASAVGGQCTVHETGCLGYCSQAPNAVVVRRGERPKIQTLIRSLEASADVVAAATGLRPNLEDDQIKQKLAGLRAARARERAKEVYHWNSALNGLGAEAVGKPRLREELDWLRRQVGSADTTGQMPEAIAEYTKWSLESVEPVSRHAAVFTYTSKDRKRGTPHPRGRGRVPRPITWHTTLLAEVGANDEGPLPWVERDYTPISSAHQWEQGRVEILIKIYADGKATSWLYRTKPETVWLSRPVRTLAVPSLVHDDGPSFRPASVLLLLAGTGVVALPQILAHRDPYGSLRISTPKRDQLRVPVDVLLSCREDDAPMAPRCAAWCREEGDAAGLRNCTLLLSPAAEGDVPFPNAPDVDVEAAVAGLENARVVRGRLSAGLLTEAYRRMPQPCRVVVSGPGEYNSAVREMLMDLVDDLDSVTVLSA